MSNIKQKKGLSGKKQVEKLVHFNCGSCGKWWSVGDAPSSKKKWYCPWCGIIQKIN